MKFQVAVLAAAVAVSNAKLFSEDAVKQKYMWENFKREWSKKYVSVEAEHAAFANFLSNLKAADLRNAAEIAAGGSAIHGISKFSDVSQEDFEKRYLKTLPPNKKMAAIQRTDFAPVNATAGLVDWTGVYTTPIKDQGYCGSCWAFSATEQIESDAARMLDKSLILSAQQCTSCDPVSYGCSGGWPEWCYNYVMGAGGIETEADYPYSSYMGVTGTCAAKKADFQVTVTSYTEVSGKSAAEKETNMASYVQATGPLSICVDASIWSTYTGGVVSACGSAINHAVQAVGVDATSKTGYWKVRNTWGTSWGESGYIRLAYGKNTCGLTYQSTYTEVK